MKYIAVLTATAWLAGCRGSVPRANGTPEQGIASVLIGCRMTLPTGETRAASMAINLEGQEGSRSSEVYRVPMNPKIPYLYQIEPGTYRLAPTRNIFGFHQPALKIDIEGRVYRVPFPREFLRKAAMIVKPTKIFAIGIVAVTVAGRVPGRDPEVRVVLDDSLEARRSLVQEVIRTQMDPSAPTASQTSAISWTRALEQTLSELLSESRRDPAFRAVP